MDEVTQISQAIARDPENAEFTKQGWTPLFHVVPSARIIVISQAPGRRAQESATYFNDPSGDRLRDWMGIDRDTFYGSERIAVMPLDFYFPGKGAHGDLPPRKGFADKWHPQLLRLMPQLELTLLVGSYAINYYLRDHKQRTLTETVAHYADYAPSFFPLVHPSPLNYGWQKKNPWFVEQVVPDLRARVAQALGR